VDPHGSLTPADDPLNNADVLFRQAGPPHKVGHVFRVLKCQFGYRRLRYRGITKNDAQDFTLLALANLYLAR
jgi:IS5 family transposase